MITIVITRNYLEHQEQAHKVIMTILFVVAYNTTPQLLTKAFLLAKHEAHRSVVYCMRDSTHVVPYKSE